MCTQHIPHFRESTLIISSHFFNQRFDILFCYMRSAPNVCRLRHQSLYTIRAYMVSRGCHSINDTNTEWHAAVRHTKIRKTMFNSAQTEKEFWQLSGQSSPRHVHMKTRSFAIWYTLWFWHSSNFFQTSILTKKKMLDFSINVDWAEFIGSGGISHFGAYPDVTVSSRTKPSEWVREDKRVEGNRCENFPLIYDMKIHRLFPNEYTVEAIRAMRHAKYMNELIWGR